MADVYQCNSSERHGFAMMSRSDFDRLTGKIDKLGRWLLIWKAIAMAAVGAAAGAFIAMLLK